MNGLLLKGFQTLVTTTRLKFLGVAVHSARSNGREPIIINGPRVVIGKRVGIGGRQFPISIGAGQHGRTTIGDNCYLNQGVTIWSEIEVSIGNHVFIGDLSAIYDTSFHEITPGHQVKIAPVVIEDDVWLGRLVTVTPGVVIGRGAVVAAHSIVTRDVAPFTVVAGSPAVPIRELDPFPEGTHRSH